MFYSKTLPFDGNPFQNLVDVTKFEKITNGRYGTVLVGGTCDLVPIVRTTTTYQQPAQIFGDAHNTVLTAIQEAFPELPTLDFNNAMIEYYEPTYRKMGFHTDQSQDLDSNSYIGVFSCYDRVPVVEETRKLVVINKETGEETKIPMAHCSVILFSTATNQKHKHKIILDSPTAGQIWLGMTFRLSKTLIHFVGDSPHFLKSDVLLRMASDSERWQLMHMKGQENKELSFDYPVLDYTISPSDIQRPYCYSTTPQEES